jgi:hypothetical protein
MEDFFDFGKLRYVLYGFIRAGEDLESMPMKQFLDEIARTGQLKLPLPLLKDNDTSNFVRTPLWDYLGASIIGYNFISKRNLYYFLSFFQRLPATHSSGTPGRPSWP